MDLSAPLTFSVWCLLVGSWGAVNLSELKKASVDDEAKEPTRLNQQSGRLLLNQNKELKDDKMHIYI